MSTTTDLRERSTLDLAPAPLEDIPRGPIWLLKDSWTEAMRHLRRCRATQSCWCSPPSSR